MKLIKIHITKRFERLDTGSQMFVRLVGWYVILCTALLTGLYLMEPSPDLSPVWLPVYTAAVAERGVHLPPGR